MNKIVLRPNKFAPRGGSVLDKLKVVARPFANVGVERRESNVKVFGPEINDDYEDVDI
jgi:hypothetical protein